MEFFFVFIVFAFGSPPTLWLWSRSIFSLSSLLLHCILYYVDERMEWSSRLLQMEAKNRALLFQAHKHTRTHVKTCHTNLTPSANVNKTKNKRERERENRTEFIFGYKYNGIHRNEMPKMAIEVIAFATLNINIFKFGHFLWLLRTQLYYPYEWKSSVVHRWRGDHDIVPNTIPLHCNLWPHPIDFNCIRIVYLLLLLLFGWPSHSKTRCSSTNIIIIQLKILFEG